MIPPSVDIRDHTTASYCLLRFRLAPYLSCLVLISFLLVALNLREYYLHNLSYVCGRFRAPLLKLRQPNVTHEQELIMLQQVCKLFLKVIASAHVFIYKIAVHCYMRGSFTLLNDSFILQKQRGKQGPKQKQPSSSHLSCHCSTSLLNIS